MMSLQRNYYEVLGLPPGATTDQIKKKYRELARKFHPDVVQDKTLGQRVFTQINQAYSVLGDPERRAQYNGTLTQNAAPASTAAKTEPTARVTDAAPPKPAAPSQAAADPMFAARKAQAYADMLSRAENAIMAGKPVEARAFCVRVLETDPRQVRAMEILGDALVQMGRREEAAVQYRNALQVSPSAMIQTKLNRVAQPLPPTRTIPPQSGNDANKTKPPTGEDAEKPSGLFGRLLGRK